MKFNVSTSRSKVQVAFDITSRIIFWAVKEENVGNMMKCRRIDVNNTCLDLF